MRGLDSMGYGREAVVEATAAFVRGFFDAYASAQGKPRWADKTPDYVDYLPEIWELFGPDARFVIVLRNGLDVAFSLADPNRKFPAISPFVEASGGRTEIGAGRFWSDQNEKIEAFRAEHAEVCDVVRYEELTAEPETVLRPMFGFLGESWEPQVLEFHRFPHHAGIEDPDIRRTRGIERNVGRSRTWPEETQRAVREACEPMLSRLGYA